jgi:hypothetical protein
VLHLPIQQKLIELLGHADKQAILRNQLTADFRGYSS